MMDDTAGWTNPFHEGELAAQDRAGVRERVAGVGRRYIHDRMPDQHRSFFAQLPFVVLGGVDGAGAPWASILTGGPGFARSPNPYTLRIDALPAADDPMAGILAAGTDIGILGLEPATRRRNRLNGRVAALDARGFAVAVTQSFGNCPSYIQKRVQLSADGPGPAGPVDRHPHPDAADRRMIAAADTFFIASAHGRSRDDARHGVDVSHRGGKPGFVRVDEDGTLTIPDFAGNNYFNTLGNLAAEPCAGLLFLDFATGDALQLTGTTEIVWDGPEVEAFAGALRLLRVRPTALVRRERAVPLTWRLEEPSPVLARTGSWQSE